jgi:hypothetical protein
VTLKGTTLEIYDKLLLEESLKLDVCLDSALASKKAIREAEFEATTEVIYKWLRNCWPANNEIEKIGNYIHFL